MMCVCVRMRESECVGFVQFQELDSVQICVELNI